MKEGYKKTEVGIIPEEWDVSRVEDLVTTLKSGLSRSLKDENVGIPCIRSNNIKNNRLVLDDLKYWYKVDDKGAKIEDYILKKGDIIINFINSVSQIGKGCIFDQDDFETIYTTNLLRIQVKEEKIINKFFYYYTQTEKYKKEVILITKPAVNQASFTTVEYKAIKFPVPTLKEQQKIAEILSTVDSQIDDIDKIIEKTKELKNGLMQRLLTKGIGHTEFKMTEIGEIPVEWEVKQISELGEIITGSTPKTSEKDNYGEDYLWVSPTDMGSKKYITNTVKKLSRIGFDKTRKLPIGSILVTCIGSTIGKLGIAKYELSTNQQINSIICNNDYCNEFIYYVLEYNFPKYMGYVSTQAVPIINKTTFSQFFIQTPDIMEQKQISAILSSIDTQIEEYENKKSKLEELKKALMQKLLTGKIRVRV